ncbi:PREDICTED: serine/threonine-protein phosphatase 6 regulatory ankyrin repeat subunit B-like [Branchiostoma belcheri]|uniref:Serine/threonine-protein phosphatase 6 regulatory ankyrin repeat subunit B-like n=1 Tax=Branchiostoma belcheri TaxID=7741 RepID=A0A6P4Y859_BRABE|nr:PREDICTED: serine/threonine-protein phosphatase 6 regulatory ankyrin repeat subunit B-like [Branchiostoma belcheri]
MTAEDLLVKCKPMEDQESTETALLVASIKGHADIVKLLLRKGASVTKRNQGISCAPLHGAAGNGHTEVVDLLVYHGATLDIRDAFLRTPLMAAIIFKEVATVRQLIEFGARVDLADAQGNTTQQYCEYNFFGEDCDCALKEMMELVQEATKNKLLRCCNPTCGKPGYSPQCPHQKPTGSPPFSESLAALMTSPFLATLLTWAEDIFTKVNSEVGADIDHAQEDQESTGTALLVASIKGHADIVGLLLRKGASVTKRNQGISCAPLHGAAGNGHTEVVDLLVYHGATLDIRDAFLRTPLMADIMFKEVRQLIEFGARVDLADAQGIFGEDCDCALKEMMELVQEATKNKLLRCCNPTCGKPGYRSTLKLCGRCKLTRYCSRDCQKQHWTVGHRKSCGHDTCTVSDGLRTFLK